MTTAASASSVNGVVAPGSSGALPDFHLPAFSDSSNGWGPSSTSLPLHLLGLPFMPFNKGEKLSKISDWSYNRDARGAAVRVAEEEEIGVEDEGGAFSVVDTKVRPKPRFGYRPFQQQQRRPFQQQGGNQQQNRGGQQREEKRNTTTTTVQQQQAQQAAAAAAASSQGSGQKVSSTIGSTAWNTLANTGGSAWTQQQAGIKRSMQTGAGQSQAPTGGRSSQSNQRQQGFGRGPQGQQQQRGRGWFFHEQKDLRLPSVEVRDDWQSVGEIELSELSGLTFEPQEDEDLQFAGSLLPFNPAFARVMPRAPIALSRFEQRQFFAASTTEDPILNKMIEDGEGNVFATDSILSLLMAAAKSVYSWDLLVRKQGDTLVLDKRADSRIDYLSVNENHSEHLSDEKDNINHAEHLALEATVIAHNFSQQCLSSQPSLDFETPNPFLSSLTPGNEPAAVAFRYHSWQLGSGVKLVARSSINAYSVRAGSTTPHYIITRCLNEFDSRISGSVEWRQKLESQTGAVFAIEMKNNAYRLARYVSEMLISSADELRLGFVSRQNPKNSYRHAVLMVKQYDLKTFSNSINLKPRGLWGSLKIIIDRLRQLPDGHFLMLRDANKPVIHIYTVPADAFQNDNPEGAEGAEAAAE